MVFDSFLTVRCHNSAGISALLVARAAFLLDGWEELDQVLQGVGFSQWLKHTEGAVDLLYGRNNRSKVGIVGLVCSNILHHLQFHILAIDFICLHLGSRLVDGLPILLAVLRKQNATGKIRSHVELA